MADRADSDPPPELVVRVVVNAAESIDEGSRTHEMGRFEYIGEFSNDDLEEALLFVGNNPWPEPNVIQRRDTRVNWGASNEIAQVVIDTVSNPIVVGALGALLSEGALWAGRTIFRRIRGSRVGEEVAVHHARQMIAIHFDEQARSLTVESVTFNVDSTVVALYSDNSHRVYEVGAKASRRGNISTALLAWRHFITNSSGDRSEN